MKVFVFFLIAAVLLVGINLMMPTGDAPDEIPELVISAYMFDADVSDPNQPGTDPEFRFERLSLNEPRLLAPVIGSDVFNLGFRFEFEGGIVEAISDSGDIQLSASAANDPRAESLDDRVFADSLRVGSDGYINMNPLGSGVGYLTLTDDTAKVSGYVGREYYLTVNACEFSNERSPVITAKVKLIQLEDKARNTTDSGASRFFSVELVTYEFSEVYAIKFGS